MVTKIRAIFGLSTNKQFFEDREKKVQTLSEESQQGAGPAEAEEEEEVEEISPEEEARERARQLLENILTRQVELCEAKRKAILKESLAGPSAYERAAEFALAHPEAALMQRMEESSFRQIWRITNLLLKGKRDAGDRETNETRVRTGNVIETNGVLRKLRIRNYELRSPKGNRKVGRVKDKG